MSFRTPSAALLSSLLLAALAGACGGVAPSSQGNASPAGAESPPIASAAPSDPGTPATPKPKYPIGPYTGAVATTDVSVLYPLAASATSPDYVRPVASGDHGALLPESIFDTVLGGRRLDRDAVASGYDTLRLVSIRLDPCSARGSATAPGACTTEVRLVFQELYDDAILGTGATDGALHVVYDVSREELVTMMRQLLTLKQANGDLGLLELAPHPILAAQGVGGAFAQGLRGIVLEHLGGDRIARATFFNHQNDEGDTWTFGAFDRAAPGAFFLPSSIPNLDVVAQTFSGSNTKGPLAQSFADPGVESPPEDSLAALLQGSRPAPGSAAAAALQPSLDAALRLENPNVRNVETTDCVSCHLAEGARRIGEGVYALPTSTEFTHTRSLARVDQRTSVTNVHAFGYLRNEVSIMQRTANESVLVAERMAGILAPK